MVLVPSQDDNVAFPRLPMAGSMPHGKRVHRRLRARRSCCSRIGNSGRCSPRSSAARVDASEHKQSAQPIHRAPTARSAISMSRTCLSEAGILQLETALSTPRNNGTAEVKLDVGAVSCSSPTFVGGSFVCDAEVITENTSTGAWAATPDASRISVAQEGTTVEDAAATAAAAVLRRLRPRAFQALRPQIPQSLAEKQSSSLQDWYRKVRFDMQAMTVHEVYSYSEVYGVHPRHFDFDKGYHMVPALGSGQHRLNAASRVVDDCEEAIEDIENDSDNDINDEFSAEWVLVHRC